MGAKGGVNYKDSTWIKALQSQLPQSRPYLDAVVDSGGGNIANTVARIMKDGGIVSCYGSTTGQDVPIGMGFILKNLEFKGERSWIYDRSAAISASPDLAFLRLDDGISCRVFRSREIH